MISENDWWLRTWNDREDSVRRAIGETDPPGTVHSVIKWPRVEHTIPGACILHFAPNKLRKYYLDISLGLSQPLSPGDNGRNFELGIYSKQLGGWQADLLYQFFLHCSSQPSQQIRPGDLFESFFFCGSDGTFYAGLGPPVVSRVGEMTGLCVWPDYHLPVITTSSNRFWILTLVCVTEKEQSLAFERSSAHLFLLFRRLGIELTYDPFRPCVTSLIDSEAEWEFIKKLSNQDAAREVRFQA